MHEELTVPLSVHDPHKFPSSSDLTNATTSQISSSPSREGDRDADALEAGERSNKAAEETAAISEVNELHPVGNTACPTPVPTPASPADAAPSAAAPATHQARIAANLAPHITLDVFQTCTKAVIAYIICCLFVLVEPIADFFGSTVYLAPIAVLLFPPVRPFGGILEIILIGILGIGFGAAVSAVGLKLSVTYMEQTNQTDTGSTGGNLIQVAFLLFAVFTLGYARAGYPRVYSGTVVACLMLGFPLTGTVDQQTNIRDTLMRVLKPLIFGTLVCVIVDLAVFPKFSGRILKSSIHKSVTESKELLDLLVKSFLLVDAETPIPLDKILAKQAQVRTAMASTKAARRECHYEITYDRYSPDDYKTLVKPLQEMMKYLGGCVACVKLEKYLVDMVETEEAEKAVQVKRNFMEQAMKNAEYRHTVHGHFQPRRSHLGPGSPGSPGGTPGLRPWEEHQGENLTVRSLNHLTTNSLRSLKAASVELRGEIAEGHHVQISGREITGGMFGGSKRLLKQYLAALSSATLGLSTACVEALEFADAHMLRVDWKPDPKHPTLFQNSKTIFLKCMGRLGYSRNGLEQFEGAQTLGAASSYGIPLDDYRSPRMNLVAAIEAFEQREWSVLAKISHQVDPMSVLSPQQAPHLVPDNHWNAANLFREEYFLASFFIFNLKQCAQKLLRFEEAVHILRSKRLSRHRFWMPKMKLSAWLRGGEVLMESNDQDNPDIPLYTEGKETFLAPGRWGKFRWSLWKCFNHLQSRQVKFGAKMAIATLILVWPAYVWQAWWQEWRCTWALVTMLIVISPTVGTSNIMGFYRILGTMAGGLCGYITWVIAPSNRASIIILSTVFAYPCLYLFIKTPHARLGTAALVTYTVVVFSTYATFRLPAPHDTIALLAIKRMITISVGVIVAVLTTSYVFPFVARTELRRGLSKSLYLVSVLYSHLAALVASNEVEKDASHYVLAKFNRSRLQIRILERALNKSVTKHLELLELTRNEPRLKGPFPYAVFSEMVSIERDIVERLGNVRRIVDGEYHDVVPGGPVALTSPRVGFGEFFRREIVMPVEKYRIDMFASLLLYLHTLSHSLHSKLPLPPFMPPARASRLRLFSKIRALPALRDPVLSDRSEEREGYIRFMAYSFAMESLIEGIEELGALHDAQQPGQIGTTNESLMASEDSHYEAIRREGSGNAMTMTQLMAGGAAGQVMEENEMHHTRATAHPNDTSMIESYNAAIEGNRAPRGL
ncbi:hypothetical protein HDU87_002669 [Geranomyces variabilis]|uniref:ER transporter 6TM N-terminal domain-containing protein n=1 Tax=Geranomyces variabilis TaxID=109894 RepID=A0AAD5XQW8_9FUNG|nr:hypothetical protein HDU87_002669 [Geranomyces variabilis]